MCGGSVYKVWICVGRMFILLWLGQPPRFAHLVTQHGPEIPVHVDPGQRAFVCGVELVEAVERHDRLLAHMGLGGERRRGEVRGM